MIAMKVEEELDVERKAKIARDAKTYAFSASATTDTRALSTRFRSLRSVTFKPYCDTAVFFIDAALNKLRPNRSLQGSLTHAMRSNQPIISKSTNLAAASISLNHVGHHRLGEGP